MMKATHANRFALKTVVAALAAFILMLICSFASVSQAHAALTAGEPATDSQLSVNTQATSIKTGVTVVGAKGARIYKDADGDSYIIFPYTGKAIKPEWDLRLGGKKLVEGRDYGVVYLGNIETGKADALFIGDQGTSGEYKDAFRLNFWILPNIAHFSVSGITNKVYTGKAQTQPAVIKDQYGWPIEKGADYTVSYKNNVNVGTATVTFAAIGSNYAGSFSKTFKITPAPISKATVALEYSSHVYTGTALKPKLKTAKYGSVTLKAGTDYTVSYKNNVNAGTATVTLTGRGNYTGSISKTFKIEPAPISMAALELKYKSHAYTGKKLKPALKTAKLGSKNLKKGKKNDYTLSYKANKNVGKATVIVKGWGNFKGSKKLTFTIVPPKPKVKAYGKMYKNKRCVVAKWSINPSVKVDYYTVMVSEDPSFLVPGKTSKMITIKKGSKYFKKRKAPITSGPNIKIRPNTTYYVIVEAYCKAGGKTYSSNWSETVECKTAQ